MKVFFLTSSLTSGGAERVASTLANAWAARGDQVTLVPTFSGGGEPFYQLNESVELLYLAQLAGIAPHSGKRYLRRLLALRRLARERRPDVVVSFLPNVNIAALLATAFTGIPCVVCERSDPTQRQLELKWRLACKLLYRVADSMVVQTESVAQSIGKLYGGLRKVAVIPNPIPEELMRWQGGANAMAQRRVLLSMGRLVEVKQVHHIISAFACLHEGYPEWDLHIHGDGPLAEPLRHQIEQAGLAGRVFLKGNTPEPWAVIAQADAFVMASAYEGFPNALLEAMAVGLPCVATDCRSGPRELSRNGSDALLASPNDEADLRNAMHRLMSDATLRRTLGTRARQSVVDRYSLPTVLAAWDAVFSSVGARR
jgi:GalNAc-alpha-(1->4)-GalNAc-alpha-(1->3)-diNAcBac-PP-undecaprenol alpha-1,4-N-acetyl-D-galactosaminyltransferase